MDEIMGRLGNSWEPVRSNASDDSATAILSRRSATPRNDVELELVDRDLDRALNLIAHDVLEMGQKRRSK